MTYYVCKYTPVEMLAGFGADCSTLENLADNFDKADACAHANLCGYGKSVIEAALAGGVEELVLVNCCDTIRRAYDVIQASGKCAFLYLLDLPHERSERAIWLYEKEIINLYSAYKAYSDKAWNIERFFAAFGNHASAKSDGEIALVGAHSGKELERYIAQKTGFAVKNLTCTGNRNVALNRAVLNESFAPRETTTGENFAPNNNKTRGDEIDDFAKVAHFYAAALINQMACQRMNDNASRRELLLDPNLRGVIYLTIKFCDFYGAEYMNMRDKIDMPLLKIESDFTKQSEGQLATRIEAFAETIRSGQMKEKLAKAAAQTDGQNVAQNVAHGAAQSETAERGKRYFVGIDSGSTSTDVVIINNDKKIVAESIIPTGAGAEQGAQKCLQLALDAAHIQYDEIANVVTTGYGREYVQTGETSVTEISCHAKGAFFLEPNVRTVIDIGGQDSKVIVLNDDGSVANFVMNDKCAAGTGRFIEAMARGLNLSLEEMSALGLSYKEDITISSMCTVFAESEVVSLVAQNKNVGDVVHGINKSVAAKVAALASRLHTHDEWMMTGGVAQNVGVVKALEARLGVRLHIAKEAQLCGALGAALYALEA